MNKQSDQVKEVDARDVELLSEEEAAREELAEQMAEDPAKMLMGMPFPEKVRFQRVLQQIRSAPAVKKERYVKPKPHFHDEVVARQKKERTATYVTPWPDGVLEAKRKSREARGIEDPHG